MIDSAAVSRAPSLLAPITTPKGQDAARFSVDTPSTTRLTNKMPTDSGYSPSGGSKVTGVGPAPQGGNSGPSTFLSSGPTAAQSGPANPNPSHELHGPEFLGNFAAKSLGSAAQILQSGPIHKIIADMGFEILGTPQISKTCSVEKTLFDTNTHMSTQLHILLGIPITYAPQNNVFLCVDMAVLRAKVPRSSVERRGRCFESVIFVILGIVVCMGNRIY